MDLYKCASCLKIVDETSLLFYNSYIPRATLIREHTKVFFRELYQDLIKIENAVLCEDCVESISIGYSMMKTSNETKKKVEKTFFAQEENRVNLLDVVKGSRITITSKKPYKEFD